MCREVRLLSCLIQVFLVIRNDLVESSFHCESFFKFGLEGVASKTIPKLREMNALQPDELKLDESQINALNQIMTEPVYEVTDLHVAAIELGLQWSIETIIFCSSESANGKHPRGADTLQRLSLLLISEPSDPVRILVCRALANACVHEPGRVMLNNEVSVISKVVVNQFEQPKQTVQVAAASALANFALLLLKHTESGSVTELGPREDVLRAVINTTERVMSFSDHSPIALTRILQSIATLMWGDSSVINLAKNREMASIINRIKDSVTEESSKNVARDCVEMIHAV
uniref:PUL domain-containing protein n=1 Tax=Ditylenchus dipsaci TaxID=166011 RepID=A0A915EUS1_9BILA